MCKKSIVIGVTGGFDGGKTSVSKVILANFKDQKIAMTQHDSYYKDQSHLAFGEHVPTNYDRPLVFDTDLMIERIGELIAGRLVDTPIYDYTQHARGEKTYRQELQDVFVAEGILVLEDKRPHDLMDTKLFVDTDDDIRIIRRIKRDMEECERSPDSVIDQYTPVAKPIYHQFIESTKRYADIIVPEGTSSIVAIDLINTRITTISE